MVERFEFGTSPNGYFWGLVKNENGEYVRYTDYATLESQLQAAEKRVEEWKALFDECAVARDTSGFLGTVPECIAHWEACATSREATVTALSRPIDMQDVRLATGEGKLTNAEVLTGVNAELRRRATLTTKEPSDAA